jgi:hypothetical protein
MSWKNLSVARIGPCFFFLSADALPNIPLLVEVTDQAAGVAPIAA